MNNEICLVNMPFATVEHPSLSLGLLETYITAFGHSVQCIHANLQLAEVIGLEDFYTIESSDYTTLVGEWAFSRATFPDFDCDDQQYFASLDLSEQGINRLLNIRQHCEAFVDKMAADIVTRKPKIVGCTSTFQQNCASLALLRKVKALDSEIITMLGGGNCEGPMGVVMSQQFDWLDYVFSGECDDVIGEFVDHLMQDKPIEPHKLPYGVIARQANRLETVTDQAPEAPRAFVKNMEVVGTPTYDSYFDTLKTLDIAKDIHVGLMVETSRGCWWGAKRHCTFCGLNGAGMEHRSKAPEVTIAEFEQLANRYDTPKMSIVDNILPVEYMKTVLPALEQQNYNLFYETKANLKKAHIEQLAAAGVKWIQPGLESLQDDFLKLIKKGTTAVQNIATLKWCRESGVRVAWNWLYNAPGENPEWYDEMSQWIELVSHLQPPQKDMVKIGYHRFSPYFDQAEAYGLDLQPIERYQYVYPLEGENLFNIAYFFESKPDSSRNNEPHAGHQQLQPKVTEWSRLFWDDPNPPVLCMMENGDAIKILDTRPVATNFMHMLEGLSAAIYRLCLTPQPRERLLPKLIEAGEQVDQATLDQHLASLIENKLLIDLSKCYFSLALHGILPPLLQSTDYPGGYLSLDESQVGW